MANNNNFDKRSPNDWEQNYQWSQMVEPGDDRFDGWNSPNLNEIFPAGAASSGDTTNRRGSAGRTKEQVINKWNKAHINWNRSTKKIAFIGDSYCADFNYTNKDKENRYLGWPELVARHFNAEILQMGFGGLGFVSSFYTAVVRHRGQGGRSILEQADIIIACVSSPDRLPSRHGFPYSPALAGALDSKEVSRSHSMPMKYLDACKAYYENIFLGNFHYIAQKGAIRELDDIVLDGIKKANQTIIWFPCFQESMCDYKPKSGVIGDAPLFDLFVQDARKANPGITQRQLTGYGFHEGPGVCNHMGRQTQGKLANHIINYISHKSKWGSRPIPIKDMLNDN